MGCWEPGTWNWEFVEWVGRYSLCVYSLIVNLCLRGRRCVRPSIQFCLLSWDVQGKGEAFTTRHCKLKEFIVVQSKISIAPLSVRKMLRPYKSGRIEMYQGTVTVPIH